MLTLEAGNPTTARGSAQNPLSHDEVAAKARPCWPPGCGVADALIRAVEGLDRARTSTNC